MVAQLVELVARIPRLSSSARHRLRPPRPITVPRPLLCCEYAAEQVCCEYAAEQVCCEYAAEQVCCE
ncbi:MAG TPA: hypothetical protein VIL94_04170, partial [Acidothermaceae bacterium]